MDELSQLEADLAALHSTMLATHSTHHRHDLVSLTNRAKEIVRAHQEAAARARLSANNDPQTLAEVEASAERLAALQASCHQAIILAQRNSLRGSGGGTKTNNIVGKKGDPADSYAADITSRLAGLNDRFQDCLQSSTQNVSTLERSVNSVKSLSTRYKAFGEVSGESKRLVSRHAAKKRRDVLMMKAAVGWFLLVCAVIFLKRLRFVWFILSLLYKITNLVPSFRRPQVGQVVDLEL